MSLFGTLFFRPAKRVHLDNLKTNAFSEQLKFEDTLADKFIKFLELRNLFGANFGSLISKIHTICPHHLRLP